MNHAPLARQFVLQSFLALVGTAAYMVYAQSWRDTAHLVYDIPANLTVFAFIAQLVLEAGQGRFVAAWGLRMVMVAVMAVVCAGRDFLGWPISGHLTCVLAVALVQTLDPQRLVAERLLYWIPVPIVLWIRWTAFDRGEHGQTYRACMIAVLLAGVVTLGTRWRGDR